MTAPSEPKERRVIPRWREAAATTETGEGLPLRRTPVPSLAADHAHALAALKRLRGDFDSTPNIGSAAEVVSAAIMLKAYDEAEDAAEFLLMHPEDTTSPALVGAQRVLGIDRLTQAATGTPPAPPSVLSLESQVRELRARVRVFPWNPLAHLDLARLFTALGSHQKAERHLRIAVGLAPQHRLTLRAVTRFLIHLDQPDRALRLLRSTDAVRHDPWLMATEIATASVAESSQQLVRLARDLLDRKQYSALDTSELAASLATLEVIDGNAKKARQMMHRALEDPTENSVAQARWVGRRVKLDQSRDEQLNVPRNFEAHAWAAYRTLDFGESRDLFTAWLRDEPFSSQPALMAGYLADLLDPAPDHAIGLTRIGVRADDHDIALRNNLAFYLASAGQLDEAEVHLAVALSQPDSLQDAAIMATCGLVAFRRGSAEQGEGLYREAIRLARTKKDEVTATTAMLYLAREAALADLEPAEALLREALAAARVITDPSLVLVASRVRRDLQRSHPASFLLEHIPHRG